MVDEKLVSDFVKHMKAVDSLAEWLDLLYYNEEFATIFNKPVVQALISACDYLHENLTILKDKYLAKID